MKQDKPMKKHRKLWPWLIIIALLLIVPFLIDRAVVASSEPYLVSKDEAAGLQADCVLVLGAGVWEGDRPSPVLQDRLLYGIALYESGAASRMLMSGDHGRKEYDEVNVMKAFAIERGVPSGHIFMDHAGFSTYESMYRARDIFKAQRIIIVTQQYHLYRAVYIARSLGLDAYGVAVSDAYTAQIHRNLRNLREMFARVKDFFYCMIKPLPTYLGEAIPVSGNGDLTNDKTFALNAGARVVATEP